MHPHKLIEAFFKFGQTLRLRRNPRLCVCVWVYVVYEDTNLYNDMGMTEVLQFEGVL